MVCLASCRTTTNREFTDFERDLIRQDIRDMFTDYDSAVVKNGLTAELKYLDTSSSFFWVPTGFDRYLSYDEVKSFLLQNMGSTKYIEMGWDSLRIEPLTRNIANYTGILKRQTRDSTGQVAVSRFVESGVVIKREDGWKLLSGQTREVR